MTTQAAPSVLPLSTRDRLLLAFADLASYGILAQPAIDLEPDAARQILYRDIIARYPDAIGSYIFWTTADEACFGRDGNLRCPLTLHHSGAEVARAAHAALHRVGVSVADGAQSPQLLVNGVHVTTGGLPPVTGPGA